MKSLLSVVLVVILMFSASLFADPFCNPAKGDCNQDGLINGDDIAAFVTELLAFRAPPPDPVAHNLCVVLAADMDGDSDVDGDDIAPFVQCLLDGGCP